MKFDIGILYNNLSSKLAFYENQLSGGYNLLESVKEFIYKYVPVISVFL
jgi:hypothetical protein